MHVSLTPVAISPIYSKSLGSTGETVAWTRWGDSMEEKYGAPYYHIHVESPPPLSSVL